MYRLQSFYGKLGLVILNFGTFPFHFFFSVIWVISKVLAQSTPLIMQHQECPDDLTIRVNLHEYEIAFQIGTFQLF